MKKAVIIIDYYLKQFEYIFFVQLIIYLLLKLEKIGQELYDNHTAGCYDVSLI